MAGRWRKFQSSVITFLARAAVSEGTQWCCVIKEIHCRWAGQIAHLVLWGNSPITTGNNRPKWTVYSVAMGCNFSISKETKEDDNTKSFSTDFSSVANSLCITWLPKLSFWPICWARPWEYSQICSWVWQRDATKMPVSLLMRSNAGLKPALLLEM